MDGVPVVEDERAASIFVHHLNVVVGGLSLVKKDATVGRLARPREWPAPAPGRPDAANAAARATGRARITTRPATAGTSSARLSAMNVAAVPINGIKTSTGMKLPVIEPMVESA